MNIMVKSFHGKSCPVLLSKNVNLQLLHSPAGDDAVVAVEGTACVAA